RIVMRLDRGGWQRCGIKGHLVQQSNPTFKCGARRGRAYLRCSRPWAQWTPHWGIEQHITIHITAGGPVGEDGSDMVPIRARAAREHEPRTSCAVVEDGRIFAGPQTEVEAPHGGATVAVGPHARLIPLSAGPIRAKPALNRAGPGGKIEAGNRSQVD